MQWVNDCWLSSVGFSLIEIVDDSGKSEILASALLVML